MKAISILLLTFAFCGTAPSALAEPTAELTLALDGDRLKATYVFSEPVSQITLPLANANGPDIDIRVVGADVSLDGDRLQSLRPFSQVTLSIGPDRRERDSIYPLALPLQGRGYVVYAPHLRATDVPSRVKLAGQPAPLSPAAADGYLLVGGVLEDHGSIRMAASAATPEVFAAEAAQRAQLLIDYYADKMARGTDQPPIILLSYSAATSPTDPGRFRGDVSSNGVVFLRIRAGSQATEASLLGRYTSFLAHEIFHLWNASRNPNRQDWWLHEGAAEYASWIAMNTLQPETAPNLEDRLTTALRSCAVYLGDKALGALPDAEARPVRYPCGATLQWIADLGARAVGFGDVFSIWRQLAAERDANGRYTAMTYLEAIGVSAPAAAATVRGVMEGRGVDRWSNLAETAKRLGADVSVGPPADFPLRLNASRALVLSACGEVHGVGDGQDGLFVQAPRGCQAFGEMTFIDSADGVDPKQNPAAYYDALHAKCAAGGVVEVIVRNEGVIATKPIRCNIPVAPAPADIVIRRALPLPTGTQD